jgi:tRNA (adenine37-N6)-methyltransferase
MSDIIIHPIAHIESDFKEKFGIPRQAGLVDALEARIVFEPEYRDPEALRGIEGFSHLWLIWQFSAAVRSDWSPTVRPPRLGGNERMGVFATRSPFRPNSLGLSCVRLIRVESTPEQGSTLIVGGADLMGGTPIFDIKPYVAYADSKPDARSGFASDAPEVLKVSIPEEINHQIPVEKRAALIGVLSEDPRPRYQHDSERIYAMSFAGMNVKFRVDNNTVIVTDIEKI